MSSDFIVAQDLVKSYTNTLALDKVSFALGQDEIFGFIGPDGSGKSTLFEIMTTLLIPDSGSGYINGLSISKDFRQIRSLIGYMPGRFSLYPDLTVHENLQFYARIFGSSIDENYYLIEGIYKLLEPFAKRKAGDLSGGMKQKLALCCALIHKPLALFLDEPTTGVDPVSRKEFWDNLLQLKEQRIPIVVSTPYMDEAVRCDKIAMIYKGRIMQTGSPQSIVDSFSGTLLSVSSSDRHRLKQQVEGLEGVQSSFSFGDSLHVAFPAGKTDALQYLNKHLEQRLKHYEIREIEPGIEDCFLQLMGKDNA